MFNGIKELFEAYPHWSLYVWYTAIGMAAIVELIGLLRWHGAIPLTWVIRGSIPTWLRFALAGWAIYHFGILTNPK